MATMTKPRTLATIPAVTTKPAEDRTTAQVLAVEITNLLQQLRPLANQVHSLVDSYQPTLSGRIDPESRAAIGVAIRAERAGRVDTTARPVGLNWMRGTTTERPLGTHAEAGRGHAVSSAANIAFTLTDAVGRLQASIDRAGVGIRILPRLPLDPTLGHIAAHLTALVHHAAAALPPAIAIPKLGKVQRELEKLVEEADVVIDGTGQMPHGNCPHCGRPTITIDFRAGLIACGTDRTTGHLERCSCGDDYCLCRFKPLEFRHEWTKSAALKKDGWWRFARLRNRPAKTPDQPQKGPATTTPTPMPDTTADSPVSTPN